MKEFKKKKKETSVRQRKVNSLLQQKISEILIGGDFPDLPGLVTIQSVESTPDLREAKVWFSCVNANPENVLKILNRSLYDIQGQLYRDASMRIVPKVRFIIDPAPLAADHLTRLLNQLK